jgi:hypothetical protein
MDDSRHTGNTRISLEQLIQLKRAERPPASFWDDFDQELHRRQLAALVNVEPWYRRAGRALAAIARRLAPAGAGATALALAVLALLRVDPLQRIASDAGPASADAEGMIIHLPEEAISVSAISAPTARSPLAQEEFRGHVRSAPQEFAAELPARRFVAVSAPVTVSSGSDTSAIYSARTLTAGTVLRSLGNAVPESL